MCNPRHRTALYRPLHTRTSGVGWCGWMTWKPQRDANVLKRFLLLWTDKTTSTTSLRCVCAELVCILSWGCRHNVCDIVLLWGIQIIIHDGTAYHGHYFAYIRDTLGAGNWSPSQRAKKSNNKKRNNNQNYNQSQGRRGPKPTGSPLEAIVHIVSRQPVHGRSGRHYCNIGVIGSVRLGLWGLACKVAREGLFLTIAPRVHLFCVDCFGWYLACPIGSC